MITDKVISLVSTTTKDHWVERRMSVSVPQTRKVKSLLHLQFTSWPGRFVNVPAVSLIIANFYSLFPTSPTAIVNFVKETLTRYDEQTTLNSIVVHCSAGVGRSGLFCVLLTAILEVMINPNTIPDIPLICGNMSCRRKNIMRDREHLKFCYTAFLFYLKELQSSKMFICVQELIFIIFKNQYHSLCMDNSNNTLQYFCLFSEFSLLTSDIICSSVELYFNSRIREN